MRLLVTGYQTWDLGIFNDKDPRLKVIREAIKKDLQRFLENGLEWLIFTGQLGFEYWVMEVALSLKSSYNLQLACIFPFDTHGQNWNEQNKEKLEHFKRLDFVKAAFSRYENPGQFRDYHQFLIDHTDGAYVFYDSEQETKLKYLFEKLQTQKNYELNLLTFERLNEVAENFSDFDR
ncbi:DUF1273 domain-containing protein [Streptococcus ovuberis]|uniref:UPF0398 protein HF992_03080 n=1 Tax=Streptococcus ovuberis TaxID=1936207 RepID=A0A7X6MXQ2_9STRE|nr:DUF1273 domain-containing protein [Streptococcus ovuberis]NKZ19836.1 DUF1273 domain-containing protein [Streptococcus ovuberis]